MDSLESLKAGRLDDSLAALQQQVRAHSLLIGAV